MTVPIEPRPAACRRCLSWVTRTLAAQSRFQSSPTNVRFGCRDREAAEIDRQRQAPPRRAFAVSPALPSLDDDVVAQRRPGGPVGIRSGLHPRRAFRRAKSSLFLSVTPSGTDDEANVRAGSKHGISRRARSSEPRRSSPLPLTSAGRRQSVPDAVKRPSPPANESSSSVIVPSASLAARRPSVNSTPYSRRVGCALRRAYGAGQLAPARECRGRQARRAHCRR